MTKYLPKPIFDEDYWKNCDVYNIIAFNKECCYDQIEAQPGNWVAYAVYHSEFIPPVGGYRVLFPTATDCLYWIRWMVLLEECLNVEDMKRTEVLLTGKAKEIAEIIDGAPDGTRSEELMKIIRPHIVQELGEDKDIFFVGSIEEYQNPNS